MGCYTGTIFNATSLQIVSLKIVQCDISLRICQANPAGETSSFISTVCVKSVPLYHFKLAYVVLDVAIKEFFETHF